jgi:hypothetical protein
MPSSRSIFVQVSAGYIAQILLFCFVIVNETGGCAAFCHFSFAETTKRKKAAGMRAFERLSGTSGTCFGEKSHEKFAFLFQPKEGTASPCWMTIGT